MMKILNSFCEKDPGTSSGTPQGPENWGIKELWKTKPEWECKKGCVESTEGTPSYMNILPFPSLLGLQK